MKKTTWILAAMMAASLSLSAGAEEQAAPAEGAEQTAAIDFDSLSWDNYVIMIDDVVYQLPCFVSDLDPAVWTTSEDMTAELSPNSYGLVYYKDNAGRQVMLQVANLGNNTITAQEGIIVGIEMDDYYWDLASSSIRLPKGIVYGQSTREDIEAAYGTPSDVYEGEYYTLVTYSTDFYEEVELEIGVESGVLQGIDMQCFREPEGFDAGEVSTEVPAEVAAYTAPTGLSEDITSPVIRIRDKYYTMPIPVSTLVADGWSIRESETDEYIEGNGSGWVGLQLEGQYFHTITRNFNANAVTPENTWVVDMTFGENDLNLDAELSGGIHLGMSEAELTALLENTNLQYERNETGDYIYYLITVNETKEQRIVNFYQGDMGYHDLDSAYAIEIVDRILDLSAFETASEETAGEETEAGTAGEETVSGDNDAAVTLLNSVQALVDAGVDQNKDSIKVILEQIKTLVGDSNASVVQLLDSTITLLSAEAVDSASVTALLSSIAALL